MKVSCFRVWKIILKFVDILSMRFCFMVTTKEITLSSIKEKGYFN